MGWGKTGLTLSLALLCAACGQGAFEPRIAGSSELSVEDPSHLLGASQQQFRRGNVALALQGFRKIVRQEPANVAAHVGVAACYDRMGRFDLSRRYYEEALALAPSSRNVRYNFALSLRLQGLHEEARRLESEAAEAALADAAAAGGSVTIELPPIEAVKVTPAVPEPGVQLVRLSFGEVALVTTPAGKAESGRQAAAGEGITVPPGSPAPKPAVKQARKDGALRILNGVGRRGLASRVRGYLDGQGLGGASVGDASVRPARSIIAYPDGGQARAKALASQLPFRAQLKAKPAGPIVLLLGRDALAFDDGLKRGASAS